MKQHLKSEFLIAPSFSSSVDQLSDDPNVQSAMHAITESLDVRTEFFNDKANAFLFATLGELVQDGSELDPREATFYASALTLLTRRHNLFTDDTDKSEKGGLTDDEYETIYDRLTNRQVTDELIQAINERRLLAESIDRLKPNGEPLDEFKLRVLNVATSEISTYAFDEDEDPVTRELVKKWRRGLIARFDEFVNDRDSMNFKNANGWVEEVNGVNNLVLPLTAAEHILKEDQSDSAAVSSRATLAHELTHTQGGVSDSKYVGIGLEEYRAEVYSGNKGGYHDMKLFARALEVVTGQSLDTVFSGENGGRREEVYQRVIACYGLKLGIDIIFARPETYRRMEANSNLRELDTSLGSFSDIIDREIERRVANGEEEKGRIVARMAKRRQVLAERNVSESVIDSLYGKSKDSIGFQLWSLAKESV